MRFDRLVFSTVLVGFTLTITPAANTWAEKVSPEPTISCSATACPKRSSHDICHFGKKEQWLEDGVVRTRYNAHCVPHCVRPETTCLVAGFPPIGQDNSIKWAKGVQPKNIFPHNLTEAGQGYVIEFEF